ncbi:uncharacterized protein AKAME5_001919500 [Lates japonicus]|uniref:Uncharacterized protein n=1 Tax=Lates japonicus TaxID=270547 RepID=A0AAD3N8K3_LATJO|nr:uncharacterized protein AKAME5_001919500 [Lates japonicus]
MGRKTQLAQTKNTTTDETEEPLANREMEEDGGHDTTHLTANEAAWEVVQKRKEYNAAKRILKEKGVRFQTPFTRMRIHWETGTRVYNSAGEVKQELERRGLAEKTPATAAEAGLESRLRSAMEW